MTGKIPDDEPGEVAEGLGHSPYDPLDPNLQAECVYFYYLDENATDPARKVRAFFIDRKKHIKHADMQCEILKIMQEIDAGGHAPPTGTSLHNLKWRRKSYFVLAMKADPGDGLSSGDAVKFTPGNWTFKDGKDTQPFPRPYQNVTGFYCLNHMRSHDCDDLKDQESEYFEFVMHHRFGHDGSGTNQGPPLGPP